MLGEVSLYACPIEGLFLGSCNEPETRYKEKSTFDKEYFYIPLVLRISVKVFAMCGEQKMMLSRHILSLLGSQKIIQKEALTPPGFKDL